jgi:hypothetical protein
MINAGIIIYSFFRSPDAQENHPANRNTLLALSMGEFSLLEKKSIGKAE